MDALTSLPRRPSLVQAEHPPSPTLHVPKVDLHVDDASHAAEKIQRGPEVDPLGERLARRQVQDLENAEVGADQGSGTRLGGVGR